MIADEHIARLQKLSRKLLDKDVLDPRLLRQRCPLQAIGSQYPKADHDLGALSRLPVELQHLILGSVDVASLFVFRRVNRCASNTVDQMVAFKKVRFWPVAG